MSYNNLYHGDPRYFTHSALDSNIRDRQLYSEFKQLEEQVRIMYTWYEDQQKELLMRKRFLALRDAWDQYQTIKALVSTYKETNGS